MRPLILMFLIVLVLNPKSYGSGLLSNPGFESGIQNKNIPGWNSYGGNAYVITNPGIARTGANSLKVYQAYTGAANYTGVYQDYISGPGAIYSADGWAYTSASDKLAGQNAAWIEVTFRDANANVLALYRSAMITTNTIASGAFPTGTWVNLSVTNQYDPGSFQITNSTANLTAPAGTYFVRYQVVFQGDARYSRGSMYFDDLNLSSEGGATYGNWNLVIR